MEEFYDKLSKDLEYFVEKYMKDQDPLLLEKINLRLSILAYSRLIKSADFSTDVFKIMEEQMANIDMSKIDFEALSKQFGLPKS